MTPQEQYPKFFSHPHYWIDAIEVENIGEFAYPKDNGETIDVGEVVDFTAQLLSELNNAHLYWSYFIPKFKPQEGEQFIKDLELAVSAGLNKKDGECVAYYAGESTQNAWVLSLINASDQKTINVCIDRTNLSRLICSEWDGDANVFDTAAYTDKLRELGYYV